jgi:hypothetical protein
MSLGNASVSLAPPAAPASGATVTLFNSNSIWGNGGLRGANVGRIRIGFIALSHASATSGLVVSAKAKGSSTWRSIDGGTGGTAGPFPATVAALSAGQDLVYDIFCSQYDDLKVEYTNSANTLTAWEPQITALIGDVHSGN